MAGMPRTSWCCFGGECWEWFTIYWAIVGDVCRFLRLVVRAIRYRVALRWCCRQRCHKQHRESVCDGRRDGQRPAYGRMLGRF